MNRIIIIGASGHGKVVADIAKLVGYVDIVFLDSNPEKKECAGHPVIGSDSMLNELDGDVFIAVGDAKVRKTIMEKNANRSYPVLVHPNAVIAEGVTIGDGTAIMAGTVINSEARIGKGCIVNTSSSIDHDCGIGDYVHIAVGAHICGTVQIGNNAWIGAGATVINNIDVCSDCLIGAGSVVIESIHTPGTYVGVPARKKGGAND